MNRNHRAKWIALLVASAACLARGSAAAEGTPPPVNLEAASRGKVWSPPPAAAGAPAEPVRVRIVDFGNDFLRGGDGAPRHHFHCHRYALVRDEATGLWSPNSPLETDYPVDVDGDGKLDDLIAYHAFSLVRPFNPLAPWYDTLAGTPRWYGGQAIYQANRAESGFSEDGVNQDHDGQFAWPRENWAVFHETYETYSPYRLAANWLWLKHDFLNGGGTGEVSFDEQSRLALLLKRYFMGVESVRFLVRDGEQCYLSEAEFEGAAAHTLNPTKTRWAKYDPREPHDIYFDAARARFEPRALNDVTGVGVYCAKDRMIPAYFGYKWYAFECDAVVRRPKRPSENMAMAQVSAPGGGEFFIGKTEVPYELWKTIFRQARSNNFVPPSQGFGFEKDGDLGSMDFRPATHSLQEPVTDLTLHDAAAWCNALSELESRAPVYYEDPQFRKPLHEVRLSPALRRPHRLPPLYVKWNADGYRLPTPSEWLAALGGQPLDGETAVVADNSNRQTQPVGTKKANAHGLHDMLGNVWELVWTFGDCYDPESAPPITVLGGDFLWPSPPADRSANPYGNRPYEGSYNLGLRVVRREAGGAKPGDARIENVPAWTIARDLVAREAAAPSPPEVKLDLVAVPGTRVEFARRETSFALWNEVRHWAAAHGFQTDYDGDMGSMDYWGFDPASGRVDPPSSHGPDEPVTDITVYDMAVWCNALSELTGHRPVYYADPQLQQVYRQAVKYRPIQFHFPEDFYQQYGKPESEDTRPVPMGAGASQSPPGAFHEDAAERVLPSIHQDPRADGYRLPSLEEFLQAALPDGQKYPWGDEPEGVFGNAWLFDNAAGTTHPVAQKNATALGLWDLFGNATELSNPPTAGEKRPFRLGGSFLDLTIGMARGRVNSDAPPPTWPYCDTGFRVVRQLADAVPLPASDRAATIAAGAKNVRSRTAAEDGERGTLGQKLDVDPARFDPLQGRVHRGNLYRNGEFQAKDPPISNPKVAWSFKTGGPVKSSPVVVDGAAYFGSWDGHVYAVDASSGRPLWKHKTKDRVTGSAAVVDGAVYIAGEDGNLYALAAGDGALKWATPCGARMAGSPAVAYGAVFIYAGTKTGSLGATMSSGPAVGLDLATGQQVWKSEVDGGEYLSAVCLDAARMYHGVPRGAEHYAVDLATGAPALRLGAGWTHQNRPMAGMVRWRNLVVVPGSMKGSLCVWDLEGEGRELWKTPLSGEQADINNGGVSGYEILAGPAVSHGRLFAGSNDGRLYAFDVASGAPLWNYQTGGPVQSSPSVAGETVYFGSWDGCLYAVGATDGKLRWKQNLGEMPQTPEEQYRFGPDEGGRIISSPWLSDGMICVGCDNGYLYAIH